jgi:hypothetical protein
VFEQHYRRGTMTTHAGGGGGKEEEEKEEDGEGGGASAAATIPVVTHGVGLSLSIRLSLRKRYHQALQHQRPRTTAITWRAASSPTSLRMRSERVRVLTADDELAATLRARSRA